MWFVTICLLLWMYKHIHPEFTIEGIQFFFPGKILSILAWKACLLPFPWWEHRCCMLLLWLIFSNKDSHTGQDAKHKTQLDPDGLPDPTAVFFLLEPHLVAPHICPSAISPISVNPNIHVAQNGTNQQKRGMADAQVGLQHLHLLFALHVPLTNEHSKLNASFLTFPVLFFFHWFGVSTENRFQVIKQRKKAG